MDPIAVSASRSETTHFVLPGQANGRGTLFGGVVMQWIDEIAAIAGARHARGPVVTVAVDALHFIAPIPVGAMVVMKAAVNLASHTSMEVGVRVEVEDPRTGARVRTTKAYLTFVAVEDDGRPRPIASLLAETDDDRRRMTAAAGRRAARLAARALGETR